ncbi:hypothetical protein FACS189464_1760 [Bacteroidia bacterium]|nr:hypothetical protein FACS189464_1760 [Bacteroidia bacterium]
MKNEVGLWRLIDERILYMGLTRNEADIQSLVVDVVTPIQTIQLKQNTVVLVNETLDIPYTAQLVIAGGNNILVTSKCDYENTGYAGYQFFEDAIDVSVINYGVSYTPFRLEFIQIIPKITDKRMNGTTDERTMNHNRITTESQ